MTEHALWTEVSRQSDGAQLISPTISVESPRDQIPLRLEFSTESSLAGHSQQLSGN